MNLRKLEVGKCYHVSTLEDGYIVLKLLGNVDPPKSMYLEMCSASGLTYHINPLRVHKEVSCDEC